MKVLIISPGFFPITDFQGGAIEKLLEIYLNYNEEVVKDDITLYTVRTSKENYDKKNYKYTKFKIIDRTSIKFKIKQYFYGFLNRLFPKYGTNAYIKEVTKNILKEQAQNKYDRIIFENNPRYIPYFKKKTQAKSKIILHLHNDYLNINVKNKNEVIDSCDEIWAVSEFIKNRIKAINENANIKVLYNGIDYDLIKKDISESMKKELKTKLQLSEDDYIFLYVGRLLKGKGVKELILAFNELNKKYSNIKLLIVGGAKSNEPKSDYQIEIEKIANNNVVFAGYINSKEIYQYYKLGNTLVVPSLCNEAFGLIILEGIASNIPIIASNDGGIVEVLGENGNYVSKDNIVEELIIKMENQLKNENDDMAEEYKVIMNKFSMENYCINFSSLLK